MDSAGPPVSVWQDQAAGRTPPPLQGDLACAVAVIGAGIAGLTTALLLAERGIETVVLEDGTIGGGETGRTTAHLSSALDDRYARLERLFGRGGAAAAGESHRAAIDRIENLVEGYRIACGFTRVPGFLFLARGDDPATLEAEHDAARRAGQPVDWVEGAPLAFDTGRALRFPDQGQFHPLFYLDGLARAFEGRGGRILGAHASDVSAGDQVTVTTDRGTVSCGHVVVATNAPINDRIAIQTKQAPYRSYVIAARVPRGSVPRALFWDTADPYHYVRTTAHDREHDLLVIGGEDHKTGQPGDIGGVVRFDRLEAWARERFPMMDSIAFRWSGQVIEPADGLAYIGRNPGGDGDRVLVATGDSGHGMTHGTLAGMILADLIEGRDNPWTALYDPARKPTGAAGTYAVENLNVAAQYRDFVTPGDLADLDHLRPGEGAVIREGLTKLAVYRAPDGSLHRLSAVCPHMGCLVRWNGLEKSWDCPCHGSRFAATGEVVNGPSALGLSPADGS